MGEQVAPNLSVNGPAGVDLTRPVAQTKQMLAAIDADVDVTNIVKGDWTFTFGPVGFIPGTKVVAFGFFKKAKRNLKIRFGMTELAPPRKARNLTKQEVIYTEAHEWLGHGWDGTVATVAQREAILVEMGLGRWIDDAEASGMTHTNAVMYVWSRGDMVTPDPSAVPYWRRPYEAVADMTVSAITALPSLFERRYTWDIDPDALKAIIVTAPVPVPVPQPEPEPDEPDPLPEPVDPCAGEKAIIANVKSAVGCP